MADLRRDAERLGRLVDDLLVMERSASAGSGRSWCAVDQVVSRHAVRTGGLNGRLGAGTVEPVSVVGDHDALTRVLENLVSNAFVHGPPAGRCSVALRRRGSGAQLSVRDEGPGPGAASSSAVFERFWRAPEASDRPGSGLGLSIVSAIVERHGGRISVDGSTFTIELPLVERVRRAWRILPEACDSHARLSRDASL